MEDLKMPGAYESVPTVTTAGTGPVGSYSRTGSYRWVRPSGTTTDPDILQEAWIDRIYGWVEWRNVEVVVSDEEYAKAMAR